MLRSGWHFVYQVIGDWLDAKAPRLGAALAYYSVFSLAPLLIIALGVAGMVFDEATARNRLVTELQNTLGEPTAKALNEIVTNMQQNGHSTWAAAIGIVVLLFGASGVFVQLQDALNTIWQVKPRPDWTIWTTISERFLSFAVVLGFGFLLLVSLIASTALSALGAWFAAAMPVTLVFWQIVNAVISWLIITVFFAMIFKLLPDAKLQWRNVWLGAAVTSLLFTLGKWLIGIYLAQSGAVTAFGAAASLVMLLIWVYYSAQILLLGAEITRVYSLWQGSAARPTANAERVTPREQAKEGISATA